MLAALLLPFALPLLAQVSDAPRPKKSLEELLYDWEIVESEAKGDRVALTVKREDKKGSGTEVARSREDVRWLAATPKQRALPESLAGGGFQAPDYDAEHAVDYAIVAARYAALNPGRTYAPPALDEVWQAAAEEVARRREPELAKLFDARALELAFAPAFDDKGELSKLWWDGFDRTVRKLTGGKFFVAILNEPPGPGGRRYFGLVRKSDNQGWEYYIKPSFAPGQEPIALR